MARSGFHPQAPSKLSSGSVRPSQKPSPDSNGSSTCPDCPTTRPADKEAAETGSNAISSSHAQAPVSFPYQELPTSSRARRCSVRWQPQGRALPGSQRIAVRPVELAEDASLDLVAKRVSGRVMSCLSTGTSGAYLLASLPSLGPLV